MERASENERRDLLDNRLISFLIWKLPVIVMIVTAIAFREPGVVGVFWGFSIGVLGSGCALNALRCGRLHCYITAPYFFVMAAVSVLHGFGILTLGSRGFLWIGLATVGGGLLLTHLPELIWGKYARPSIDSGKPSAGTPA